MLHQIEWLSGHFQALICSLTARPNDLEDHENAFTSRTCCIIKGDTLNILLLSRRWLIPVYRPVSQIMQVVVSVQFHQLAHRGLAGSLDFVKGWFPFAVCPQPATPLRQHWLKYRRTGAPFHSSRLPEDKIHDRTHVRNVYARDRRERIGSMVLSRLSGRPLCEEGEERNFQGKIRDILGKRFPGPAPWFTFNKLPSSAVL